MANERKWTKGPWSAEGPDDFGDFNILHEADSLAIGAVVSNLRPPEEVRANALIEASAPDLYEALEELKLVTTLRSVGPKIEKRRMRAYEAARAALAKARGEPS